jgi:SAM-dependent methyltransferase
VDRGLWDYVHDAGTARGYDAALAGSTLFTLDEAFVERHCPPRGRLLDLGCGTGRLLQALARTGRTVVGVDLSRPMLAQAQARAAAAGCRFQLIHANLVELDCLAGERFDCAACLFSTLGMVRGSAARRRVVAHTFRCLRPGGRFVVHVHNRWFNFWNQEGRRWLLRACLRGDAGCETGDRRMPPHQGVGPLTLHLFTRREAVRLLSEAGFRVQEIQSVGLRPDGRLPCPAWFGWLRAYGYLFAAEKPA